MKWNKVIYRFLSQLFYRFIILNNEDSLCSLFTCRDLCCFDEMIWLNLALILLYIFGRMNWNILTLIMKNFQLCDLWKLPKIVIVFYIFTLFDKVLYFTHIFVHVCECIKHIFTSNTFCINHNFTSQVNIHCTDVTKISLSLAWVARI